MPTASSADARRCAAWACSVSRRPSRAAASRLRRRWTGRRDGTGDAQPSRCDRPAGPSPLPTEAITFDGPDGRKVQGAWAAADRAHGAVLVIHENRGLTDHIRSVAGRLAASGYSALAVDLLSEEGGTGVVPGRGGGDARR